MSAGAPRHLIIAGAQRCGTTWLARAVARHPRVLQADPPRPEPKWFLDERCEVEGVDAYRARWFAGAEPDQVLLDKSTSYLESPAAARRMATLLPEAPVLVVLRDPVERARSHARFSIQHGAEQRSLVDALRAEDEPGWDREQYSVSPFAYRARSRYVEALAPFAAALVPGALRVVVFEEITTDRSVLAGLLEDVGLDPASYPDGELPAENASAGADEPLPPDLVAAMAAHFEPSIRALEELLGRSLDVWRR